MIGDVETVYHSHPDGGEGLLAIIFRAGDRGEGANFPTPRELPLQVGFLKHPAGKEIRAHVHPPFERSITGTPEVLVVRRGALTMDLYLATGELYCTKTVGSGDVVLLLRGGHGFRVVRECEIVEVKVGPYTDHLDKHHIPDRTMSVDEKRELNPEFCGMKSHHYTCTCGGAAGDR